MKPYVRPTPRQRQVLAAYVETGSVRDAAAKLGLSKGTAAVYLDRMRSRTGLTTAQAIYCGVRDGWLIVQL